MLRNTLESMCAGMDTMRALSLSIIVAEHSKRYFLLCSKIVANGRIAHMVYVFKKTLSRVSLAKLWCLPFAVVFSIGQVLRGGRSG